MGWIPMASALYWDFRRSPAVSPEQPFAVRMVQNGSIPNHATAQMHHKQAHRAAFHQHFNTGLSPTEPFI